MSETTHELVLSEPTPEQRRRLERWRISTFWVLLIGYVGYYIGRGNLSVALPSISSTFGYSNEQLGIILTISELAYAIGKLTLGPVADKMGGRIVFLTGIAGAIVFNLLFPQFSSIAGFTVVWSGCRFFLSMGWGGIIKIIGEWFEPERNGTVMGAISLNFQFGAAVATIFCGLLLQWGADWKGLFYYPALVMTVIAFWAYFASREKPEDVVPGVRFGKSAGKKTALIRIEQVGGRRRTRDIVYGLLRVRMFRQILIFSILSHLLRSIFMFWTPKFLVDIGMGPVAAAITSAVFPLFGCAGTLFIGWYTDHHAKDGDRARMMWIMLIGLTVCMFAVSRLSVFGLEWGYALVAFLAMGGFFLYGPYSMSAGCLSLDIAGPEAAGTCTGLIDGVGYIGGALAAWGAGVISTRLGWSQVFLVLSGVSVLAVLSALSMSRAYHQDQRERTAA